ncbi:MAG: hypothetical protein GTN38_03755 [Candidatus Aenigmarchaeota archaeon]|nr:hypothetical protein [Candidatus Aenigmarchaeota archaeon]NIP40778.1 hypothetical protein [Candidatus Aenigmarchaeota archaeon]NIQ17368.1 hypothetical protein [Candidatus Aenigmarchaeota archaeon]NIS73481.1 hypothetical protein [Candidatus Aenigmarchaeota archaeon]
MRSESSVRDYLKGMVSDLPRREKYRKLLSIYQNTDSEILRGYIRTEVGEMLTEFLYKAVKGMSRETLKIYNIPVDEVVNESMVRILGEKLDTYNTEKGSPFESYVFRVVRDSVSNVVEGLRAVSQGPNGKGKEEDVKGTDRGAYYGEYKYRGLIILNQHSSKIHDRTLERIISKDTEKKIKAALNDSLNEREFFVLSQLHGLGYGPVLDGHAYVREEYKTPGEIGELLEIGQQQVNELEDRAYEKLGKIKRIRKMAGDWAVI